MPRHEHPPIGHLVQALSRKMDEMQREIASLRQDVKTLAFLVKNQKAQNSPLSESEKQISEDEREEEQDSARL